MNKITTGIKANQSIRIGTLFFALVVAVTAVFTFVNAMALLAEPLQAGDPEILQVDFSSDLPLYENPGSDRIVYFNNNQAGQLTASFQISGTPPLTFTAGPGFDQATSITLTNSITNWTVPIVYQVTTGDVSENIAYTVNNALTDTAVITYIQDITAPTTTLQPIPDIISMTTSTLVLSGTVQDTESGISDTHAAVNSNPLTITLDNTTDPITQSGWSASWSVPPNTDGGSYNLEYWSEDNVDNIEGTQSVMFEVDNVPPQITLSTTVPALITSSFSSPLMLTGFVQDGRGITLTKGVTVSIDSSPLTVVLANQTPPIQQSDWSADWPVPAMTDGVLFKLAYGGKDDAGNTAAPSSQTFLVDNYVPDPLNPTLAIVNSTAMVSWGMSAADVAKYQVQVQNDDGATISDQIVTDTSLTLPVECGHTYQALIRAFDQVGNVSGWATTAMSNVINCQIFLPMVVYQITLIANGDITIDSARFAGATSYIPAVTLDFSSITFSQTPTEMRIWRADQPVPNTWVVYQETGNTLTLNDQTLGLQEINAQFRRPGFSEAAVTTTPVFYIPNGDFNDNSLADWVTSGGLPAAIVNGNLRLGDSTSSCTNSPPGVATAVINLDMPTDSGYKLYIDA
ncbi:MAG: hypothetical protein GY796_01125, partial [Chloroflexi bacterium]|nr:hypothetical protein [Chloroflexota bacterium]